MYVKMNGRIDFFSKYKHVKDPCVVFDGALFHIYGTGDLEQGRWEIFHATSEAVNGPWKELDVVVIDTYVKGSGISAPGVVFDKENNQFHMFLQTEYNVIGGKIEHLISSDGVNFVYSDTALGYLVESEEQCIYDPQPVVIDKTKYLTYSASAIVGQPDICLAKSVSDSWAGPWKRLGKILSHNDIKNHNKIGKEGYEWGLEGSHIVELPNKAILLSVVCFLASEKPGSKQRVFLSLATNIMGPYKEIGIPVNPNEEEWQSGENGHPSIFQSDGNLVLFYQARGLGPDSRWGIGTAEVSNI